MTMPSDTFAVEILDSILDEELFDPLRAQNLLQTLQNEHGPCVYGRLLHHLTRMEFGDEEAACHWRAILVRKDELQKALGRHVALRTAVCDYFLSASAVFDKPMLIETQAFRMHEQQSIIDELTGLYNRRFFNKELAKEIERSKRFGRPLSLLMFDVDHFKNYNDTYGHPEGDKVLKAVGGILSKCARSVDMVFRYGGEEFAALLPGADAQQSILAAERHRHAVASHAFDMGKVSVSIGSATFPGDAQDETELLVQADRALYRAKGTGRNRTCANFEDMRKDPRFPLHMQAELRGDKMPKAAVLGTTVNISKSGMLYMSPEPIEVGSDVQAVLQDPTKGPLSPLEGHAVHTFRDQNNEGSFFVGLSLKSDSAQELIDPLLQGMHEKKQS
jgi:diguanylate cyclase (GGDEF)-like protein